MSSSINEGSPIPELMKLIENILTDSEKKTKIEMKNLVRDCDSVKEELRLLETTQRSMENEKSKTEEKLQRSLMELEELKGTMTALNDRYLKMEEMHNKMSADNSKMFAELVKLRKENEDLSRKKIESDKECEVYKRQVDELTPRITKMEELFATGLNVKVEDLTNIVAAFEKLPAASASNGDDENVVVLLSKKGGRNWDCSKAQIIGLKELEGCSASLYKKRGHIKTKDGPAEYDECIEIESAHKLKKQKIIVIDDD